MIRNRNERGQASMVLILAVPALLFAALVIITIASDAMGKRSETHSAADAAALAAAEEWRSYVSRAIEEADGLSPEKALKRLQPVLASDASLLDSGPVARRARELAAANDAQVISRDVRRTGRGIEFSVTTRNVDAVNESSIRTEASATARVTLTGGACWRGSRLGLVYEGTCLDWNGLVKELTPDEDADAPSEGDDSDSDDAVTSEPTVSLTPLRAEVRLVA